MDSRVCPTPTPSGVVETWYQLALARVSVLGSSSIVFVFLLAIGALLFKIWRTIAVNAELRARIATLETACAEHELFRRRSACSVHESKEALRSRTEEMENELSDLRLEAADSDLRVIQLQSQVDELHRANALDSCRREELAGCLRNHRMSLSHSREEKQRLEEECRSLRVDRDYVLDELTNERQVSNTLRFEMQELNQLLQEARGEFARRQSSCGRAAHALPWSGNADLERFAEAMGRGEEGLDDAVLRRLAELLVRDLPTHSSDSVERQRAQRQLLTCLHPDKWPSARIATRLMQEVQRSQCWVSLGQRGGA